MVGFVSKMCTRLEHKLTHPAVEVNVARREVSQTLFPDSHPRVAYVRGLTLNACYGGVGYGSVRNLRLGL